MKKWIHYFSGIFVLIFAASCSRTPSEADNRVPGYLEAELVEIASPESGYLETLSVRRGGMVEAGAPLFALQASTQESNAKESAAALAAAKARLDDARLGLRPLEIEAMAAELEKAKTALELATITVQRDRALFAEGAIPKSVLDQAESAVAQATQNVVSQQARLRLAQEGQRALQLEALQDQVVSAEARLELARWQEAQTVQTAPFPAFVQETFYEPGEWVSSARPVVSLRQRDLLRVRFFLSPAQLKSIQLESTVKVLLAESDDAIEATVDRVSDQPEFTPPVIFSREQTAKLVFMVEARLPAAWANRLHPGLPVTVEFEEAMREQGR